MFRSSLAVIFFITISLYAQNKWSVEINGGIVIPNNAKNGTVFQFKTNYSINEHVTFFTSINYQSYGFMKRIISTENRLNTFDEERNHKYYSFSTGSNWNFISFKTLKGFFLAEVGLGYLEYNKNRLQERDINNEISTLAIDTRQNETKLLYNVGLGFGVSNKLTESIDVNLIMKLSSFGGKDYTKISEKNSLITQLLFGVKYDL